MKKPIHVHPRCLVANNPDYDRKHSVKNGLDAKGYTQAIRDTRYDTYYRTTHKGHSVSWDEPTGNRVLDIANKIRKSIQQKRAAEGRTRLHSKNSIPMKTTTRKKLFDEFMRQGVDSTCKSERNVKSRTMEY